MHVWLPLVRTGTGSEVYTRRLAEKLSSRGHRVTLTAVSHKWQYAPWLAPMPVPKGADVILANSWYAAAFDRGPPLVSVCHLVVHDPALSAHKSFAQSIFHRSFVKPMERAAVKRATINIAVSDKVSRQMRQLLGATNVFTVLNGVDTDYFRPPARARSQSGPLRLLFVGKPSSRKGFDTVSEIVTRLGPLVTFTCVGELPQQTGPNGYYTGPLGRAEILKAYQNADVLLLPSRMEGFGLVAAEAMACGVPVAACRDTAVDEIIPPGGGIVCGPSDIKGFIEQIGHLYDDRGMLFNMREIVRSHAVDRLSERVWVENTERILELAHSGGRGLSELPSGLIARA